jgi:hypothetical protein
MGVKIYDVLKNVLAKNDEEHILEKDLTENTVGFMKINILPKVLCPTYEESYQKGLTRALIEQKIVDDEVFGVSDRGTVTG